MRTRASVWVINTNAGWGEERLYVLARSRSGRLIRTWVATKHLTNFRAVWMPEHLRESCTKWDEKVDAAAWAEMVEARWCSGTGDTTVPKPLEKP